eukprot:scaffold97375_cov70-Phaeocystis_antarctica.AAC.3
MPSSHPSPLYPIAVAAAFSRALSSSQVALSLPSVASEADGTDAGAAVLGAETCSARCTPLGTLSAGEEGAAGASPDPEPSSSSSSSSASHSARE